MKPIISSFIFSEDTQHMANQGVPGGALHIINPQNIIRPPFVPGSYTFSVSFSLIKVDPDKEHRVRFLLESPEGEISVDTQELNLPINKEHDPKLPKEASGLIMNFAFRNIPLRVEGEYRGKIVFDDEEIGSYPLLVYSQGL